MKNSSSLDKEISRILEKQISTMKDNQNGQGNSTNHIYNELMTNEKIKSAMDEIRFAKEKMAIEIAEKVKEVTEKHEPYITNLENNLAMLLKMHSKG